MRFGMTLVVLTAALGCNEGSADESTDATPVALDGQGVAICFKNHTIGVPEAAVPLLLDHGAYKGPCATFQDRTTLGGVHAQSYVQINSDGSPYAIGASFD